MLGKVQEDFLVSNLEKKKHFKDFFIHADSSEEVSDFTKKSLQELGYLLAFADAQILESKGVEKVIDDSSSTPVKVMAKGVKKIRLGSKYPVLWKLGAGFSTLTFLYYLFFSTIATQVVLGALMLGGVAVTAGSLLARDSVNVSLWFKAIGVVKNQEGGRFRVVVAGESSSEDPISSDYLSESFAEFSDYYSRYFIKHKSISGFVSSGSSLSEVLETVNSIQSRIKKINKDFDKGALSDSDYERLLRESEKQRANAILAAELLSSIK